MPFNPTTKNYVQTSEIISVNLFELVRFNDRREFFYAQLIVSIFDPHKQQHFYLNCLFLPHICS
jgi:hypothetical protein